MEKLNSFGSRSDSFTVHTLCIYMFAWIGHGYMQDTHTKYQYIHVYSRFFSALCLCYLFYLKHCAGTGATNNLFAKSPNRWH